jgi:multidrug efflux pump subunit AcrA (membrane-fusion protein)
MIALAVVLLVGNFSDLVHLLPRAFHWETLLLAWIILGVVTLLHEFAHGLTCKHYGGEVHEVGFLLMLFMPCFYCNVSDSWLFREKRKRLLVMLAGGYCDLVLWSLAVFVWRLTHSQTIVHYIACVVLSICGGRVLLNFNPLMRLDGYYLLSDWAEIPNLRKRSWDYVMAYVRHFLWGAQAPEQEDRKYFLFLYGILSWCFCIVYVSLAMVGLIKLGGLRLGMVGMAIAGFLAFFILRNLVSGVGGGEFMKMLLQRHKRATVWGSILLGIPVILFAIPSEERAGGAFQIRSVTRIEVRAEVTGILKKVLIDEGKHVGQGDVIARLEIPDLDSKVKQKEAEWDEANQQLKLLAAGPRYLEIQEQEARVARAKQYFELAQKDLENARQAYQSELNKLDLQVQQYTAERDLARDQYLAERKLGGIDSRLELARYKKAYDVAQSQFDQAEATRKERAATGTQTFEAEAARRQKDLAEAESALKLLRAGTRKETIDAQQSHVDRLFEELKYMRGLADKLDITCPVENGVVMVPRYTAQSGREADGLASKLSERVGQRFNEGDLICIIEDPSDLEMDISVDEQEAARVAAGQSADMKVRALPFSTFTGKISRVAPNAVPGEGQSIVHVYCHVENPSVELKSGMTGHARIHCGHRQLGVTLVEKVLRYLRTELWW